MDLFDIPAMLAFQLISSKIVTARCYTPKKTSGWVTTIMTATIRVKCVVGERQW